MEKPEGRRLARARGTHEGNRLAGLCHEREIEDGRALAIIGETHAVEGHFAGEATRIGRIGAILHLRHGIDHVEEFLELRALHEELVDEAHGRLQLADQQGRIADEVTISPMVARSCRWR